MSIILVEVPDPTQQFPTEAYWWLTTCGEALHALLLLLQPRCSQGSPPPGDRPCERISALDCQVRDVAASFDLLIAAF